MSPAQKLADEKARRPHKSGDRKRVWNCCLAEMRTKLGLTLRDVESKTGVSNANICHVEKGFDVNLTTARKLADFFAVTVEEMWPTRYGFELRKGAK